MLEIHRTLGGKVRLYRRRAGELHAGTCLLFLITGLGFITVDRPFNTSSNIRSSVPYRSTRSDCVPRLHVAISLLGRHFNNVLMDKSVQLLSTQNAEEAARSNRDLIQSLAGPETEEAARALEALVADP